MCYLLTTYTIVKKYFYFTLQTLYILFCLAPIATERNQNYTQGYFFLMKISVLRRNYCIANFFLGKCPIAEISVTFRLKDFCLNDISPNQHFYKKICKSKKKLASCYNFCFSQFWLCHQQLSRKTLRGSSGSLVFYSSCLNHVTICIF